MLILHEGGDYNKEIFHLEPDTWDHEHCDLCGKGIDAMALCYVTAHGTYIALCTSCYHRHVLCSIKYWLLKLLGIRVK